MNKNSKYEGLIVPLDGINAIALERIQQVTKHGRTDEYDAKYNKDHQLAQAAWVLSTPITLYINGKADETIPSEEDFQEGALGLCPKDWNKEIWKHMYSKDYKERLIIAGALIAAEIDRLNFINK